MTRSDDSAKLRSYREEDAFVLRFAGSWTVRDNTPHWSEAIGELREAEGLQARFDTEELGPFDSVLASFLLRFVEEAEAMGRTVDRESLPIELRRLLELAETVPAKEDVGAKEERGPYLDRVGRWTLEVYHGFEALATFVGESALAGWRFVTRRSRMRWREFWEVLDSVSVKALPIVSLISFLMGVIISFLGAVTLRQFGAEFAVSYLVGYGMLREMGAVMTGIIMAGRTGAAFAAQIGSMKVNEEIDALRTFGIDPYDFLVLPRLLALALMLPVLTLYANVIGVLSGWVVAEFAMGVPGPVFFEEMNRVVDVEDFLLGIFKAGVFGVLVAASGCLRGLQCGFGADAVGRAATSAVVTAITLIIFANAVIDWAAATLNI